MIPKVITLNIEMFKSEKYVRQCLFCSRTNVIENFRKKNLSESISSYVKKGRGTSSITLQVSLQERHTVLKISVSQPVSLKALFWWSAKLFYSFKRIQKLPFKFILTRYKKVWKRAKKIKRCKAGRQNVYNYLWGSAMLVGNHCFR